MIAIYVRLSKEEEESSSISNQIREGTQYAKLNGYTQDQIRIYNEGEGLKGSTPIEKRPALNNLIKDVKDGQVQIVWTRKQSRITRKMKILEAFLEPMIENDIKLFMGDRGLLDLSQPTTKLMLQIFGAMDEFAPSSQSSETIRALRDNAREGKVSGILPYGYTSDENKYPIIIKEEQDIINKIFDLYLDGMGCQRIANYLNDNNIPTKYQSMVMENEKLILTKNRKHRHGVIWQSSTIYGILNNTWYNGTRTYQNEEYPVPRMITKNKWQQVQNLKKNKKHKRFEGTPKYDYLLRSIIKCDICERNFIGRTRLTKNDNFYYCTSKRAGVTNCGNHSLNISKTDSFIIQHLWKSRNLINHLEDIKANNTVVSALNEELSTLQNNIQSNQSKVQRYATLLGEELEDDILIINKYKTAKKNVQELKSKLTTLQHKIEMATSDKALNKYKTTFDKLQFETDFNTLQKATEQIIDSIYVRGSRDKNNKVNFTLKIKYKNLNIGTDDYMLWVTHRPLKEWLPVLSHTPATGEEIKEQLMEDKEAFEFAFGKTDYEPEPIDAVISKYNYEPIIITKENQIDFNKQPRNK